MRDITLKLEGVSGESVIDGHEGEIDVQSWDWGMTQSGTTHIATGGGAGKVNIQDLTITKWVDKSSPTLMKYCCSGKHFPSAMLTLRKAGDKPVEYYKVTMKKLLITSIQTGGSGGDDRLSETVMFNFAKLKVDYTPQKEDGSAEATVTVGWNIATNKEM